MNVTTRGCKPYMKPSNVPLYIHKENYYPPSIIKNILGNIDKRLSVISSDEKVFNKAAKDYQIALEKSEYADKLKYRPNKNNSNHKNTAENKSRRGKEITHGLTHH